MTKFRVDTDTFTVAISAYKKELDNLQRIKNSIQKILDELRRDGWNSAAGDACMKKFEKDWSKDMDKYIVFVEHLNNVLSQSKPEFDKLVEQAKDLQNIG